MKTELELFEKYASDTYESIARYETLPTRPYKSLEVEAAHDAWMCRSLLGGWISVDNELPILKALNVDNYESISDYVIGLREDGQVLKVQLYSWIIDTLDSRKTDFISDVNEMYVTEEITHWMPLPIRPKQDEQQ